MEWAVDRKRQPYNQANASATAVLPTCTAVHEDRGDEINTADGAIPDFITVPPPPPG
jgi:hypothetical protein